MNSKHLSRRDYLKLMGAGATLTAASLPSPPRPGSLMIRQTGRAGCDGGTRPGSACLSIGASIASWGGTSG